MAAPSVAGGAGVVVLAPVTSWLLADGSHGTDIATVLSLDVGVAGVVIGVLALRTGEHANTPRSPTRCGIAAN
ncbi:MAG TPA: hypothetical protein VFX16_36760 [Pseudonocardiaceae bacterium]|nr:hypothetical protein [Pseudonocardiaceae bacterium]